MIVIPACNVHKTRETFPEVNSVHVSLKKLTNFTHISGEVLKINNQSLMFYN